MARNSQNAANAPKSGGRINAAGRQSLRVPDELQKQSMLDSFFHNTYTVSFSDRLYDAGFRTIGDLDGKTEAEIRHAVRTTEKNWLRFKWVLATTYDAKFTQLRK